MRRAILSLATVVLLAALGSPAFARDEIFTRSYPLANGGTFALSNVNGSVEVNGWEKQEVEIRAVKSCRGSSDGLLQVQVEVEASPESVAVRTRYPESGGGVEVNVDYRIRLPYHVLLRRVETVNGSVRVGGVEGAGELHSVNGNVEVLDSAGRFSAHTTNGNVRLELRRLPDGPPTSIATVNGSVVLALPAEANADLDVRSLNGDFHSELPATVESSVHGREFRARLGRGGSVVSVETVNGGIRVLRVRPAV